MSRNRAIRLLTLLASLFVAGPTFVGLGLTGLVVGSGTALLTAWASYLIWAALTVLIGNALVTLRGTPRLAERQLAFVSELAGRQQAVSQ